MNVGFSALSDIKIDGRPLHRYRISEEQFDQLELSLMRELSGRQYRSAASSFVLWASEQYRREFEGGAFSWNFLTEPLSVTVDQAELRGMTELGLRRFRRPPPYKTDGGIQYLRALAAEGGIPVHLLSQEGGYRQALLGLVSDLDRFGAGCAHEEAKAFASRRTLKLPLGYRTEEFLDLFVEFAREISGLRQQAPDGLDTNGIENWLDKTRPGWRNDLVLRLDKTAARSLLSQALAQSNSIGRVNAPILRQLKKVNEGGWVGHVSIADSSSLPLHLLQLEMSNQARFRVSGIGMLAEVCPDLMISVEADDDRRQWSCKRISGRRSAEFSYPLDAALEFVAMADGIFLNQVELPGGAAIQMDQMPSLWLTAETGEGGNPIRLEHAGNANLKTLDDHIWVHIPDGLRLNHGDAIEAEEAERALGGTLWRVSGKGRLSSRDWNAAIETKAENTDRDELVAYGQLSAAIRDNSGLPVYRGAPSLLFRKAGRSFHAPSPRSIRYRPRGTHVWKRRVPESHFMGTLDVAIEEDGGIGARVTVRIVPELGKVSVGRDNAISFHEFPAGWLLRIEDGDPVTIHEFGETKIPLAAGAWQKEKLKVVLSGPDRRETLEWWLVLPRARADFADIEGDILGQHETVTIEALRKWKFVASGNGKSSLGINFLGRGSNGAGARIAFDVPATTPLSGFRSTVESFLSLGSPDSELRLRAMCGAEQSPRLVVRRYLQETALEDDRLLVRKDGSLEEILEDLVISAIDLDAPKKQRVLTASENSSLSSSLGAGRWFLIPKIGNVALRPPPPLYNPAEDCEIESIGPIASPEMVAASGHRRWGDRIAAFSDLLVDPVELDIQVLEVTIDWLLKQGISAAVLDTIHALNSQPQSAVLLLLRCASDSLFDRLSLEVHGSPRWDFISPEDWGAAFVAHMTSVSKKLAAIPALAEGAEAQARETLRMRLKEILRLRPDLAGHVALGLLGGRLCGFGEIANWLGSLPASFGNPENALKDIATETVRRHGTCGMTFPDLLARSSPQRFSDFDEGLRGLIEAPLFVAEIAFGQRPAPTLRQKVQLLQARYLDSGIYEQALPAAMAWKMMQGAKLDA